MILIIIPERRSDKNVRKNSLPKFTTFNIQYGWRGNLCHGGIRSRMMNVPSKHFSKKRKRKRELSFNMTRYLLLLLGILFRFYSVECVIISQAQPRRIESSYHAKGRGKKGKKRKGWIFLSNCGSTTTSCQQLIRADNGVDRNSIPNVDPSP